MIVFDSTEVVTYNTTYFFSSFVLLFDEQKPGAENYLIKKSAIILKLQKWLQLRYGFCKKLHQHKFSTGQRFICTDVTSYKVHTLTTMAFLKPYLFIHEFQLNLSRPIYLQCPYQSFIEIFVDS